MLVIRLRRIGKKHQPSYRVVVSERRSKLGGPPVEDLGFYNPSTKSFSAKKDRVEYWLSHGAHATPTVHNLLVTHKVLVAPKIKLRIKMKAQVAEPAAAPAV